MTPTAAEAKAKANTPTAMKTLINLLLSIVSSVVAVVYVAPLAEPSFYAVVVKVLPCLGLFYYIWVTTTPKKVFPPTTSTWKAVLALLGLSVDTTKKASGKAFKKGSIAWNAQEEEEESRDMIVRMSRALFFSIIGDAFLIWHEVETPFLFGMAMFALAQLCYIHALGFKTMDLLRGVLLFGCLMPVLFFLLLDAPNLFRAVVPFYAMLLITTLWRTLDRVSQHDGRPVWKRKMMAFGAAAFVVSDASIVVFKFLLTDTSVVVAQSVILSTYFLAQTLLVVGAV